MRRVLIVGGAGYVGSAAAAYLIDQGHEVWILDDLSTGHRDLVLVPSERFIEAKAGDRARVADVLKRGRIDCVMHFAAKAQVAESVAKPELYRQVNVEETRALVEAMLSVGVTNLVFSSTCAIFGDPGDRAISEDLPKKPVSPYGQTKLDAELMLEEFSRTRGLRAIALRYFNAAGADLKQRVGELHDPETHLIPKVLKAALAGQPVDLYGTDYPTPDGTALRDYVHVTDLASAHEAAMERLLAATAQADESRPSGGMFEAYNLGSARGYSVREIIEAAESIARKKIAVRAMPRRAGDPPRLVADATRARQVLGFKTGSIRDVVQSAWIWEKKTRGELSRAVFLDRDGTINVDPGYLSQPDQMNLIPGVGPSLAKLQAAGFKLVVVSNQSGVGRGLFKESVLKEIHDRLLSLLQPFGATIDRFELCLHKPEDDCACRKPHPKLLVDAAQELGIDLARSFMVGDKVSDIDAGKNAGCSASVLVRTGAGAKAERELKPGQASFIAGSLPEAADWILSQKDSRTSSL